MNKENLYTYMEKRLSDGDVKWLKQESLWLGMPQQ
jgi:hypothetical protein